MYKKEYTPTSIEVVSLQSGGAILSGSISPAPIEIEEEYVEVETFENDKTFQDEGQWDISF